MVTVGFAGGGLVSALHGAAAPVLAGGVAVSGGALLVACALALTLWPGRSRLSIERPRGGRAGGWGGGGGRAVGLDGRHARHRLVRAAALGLAVLVAAQAVQWQLVVAALVAAATAWRLVRRGRETSRAARSARDLLVTLRALVRELGAGATGPQALDRVARTAPTGVRVLLRLIAVPESQADSLTGDLERIRSAWRLSSEHGIPLAAVLSACIADLEDRVATRQLRAQHVAGPAVSGYVLAVLPLAGIAMGAGMGSNPVAVLLGGAVGGVLLCAGVTLCCAGLLWTDRIVRGGLDG